MKLSLQRIVAAAVVLQYFPTIGHAQWLCWTSTLGMRIECALPDGTRQHELITSDGKPRGLAVDNAGETLYWSERDSERIMSIPLSGSAGATTLVQLPVGTGLRGMAVAPSIGKIYWVAENLQTIQRANLDGTVVEALPIPAGSFFDVQVDDVAGVLYWIDGNEIWRGNLEGTSRTAIIGDTDQPYYLALDLQAGNLYWTDYLRNEISRSNLDGSGRVELVTGLLGRPVGITLDRQASKIYWTLAGGEILRADFSGANVEAVLSDLQYPWDIALVESIPTVGAIPSASTWGIVAFSLLLLSAGTIVTLRRHRALPEV